MKQLFALILIEKIILSGFSQTLIFKEDFESSKPEKQYFSNFADNGSGDYFCVTGIGKTNSLPVYSNIQGNRFVAAEDIDAVGFSPAVMTFVPVDLNYFNNVSLSIAIAASEKMKLDADDFFKIEYEKNNEGKYYTLCAFYGYDWINNDKTNGTMREDINLDGRADKEGKELNASFQIFTYPIDGSVKAIRFRIILSVNSADEEVAFDDISITGTAVDSSPSFPQFLSDYPALKEITDSSATVEYASNLPGKIFCSINSCIEFRNIHIPFSYFPLSDTFYNLLPDTEYQLSFYSSPINNPTELQYIGQISLRTLPVDTISPLIQNIRFPQANPYQVSPCPILSITINELVFPKNGLLKIIDKNTGLCSFSVFLTDPSVEIMNDKNLKTTTINVLINKRLLSNHEYNLIIDENSLFDKAGNHLTFPSEGICFKTRPENLFFSEYIEGTGNNKALEIFNPLDKPVLLDHYFIRSVTNGSAWNKTIFTFPKNKMLLPGKVYTIVNKSADSVMTFKADTLLGSTQAGNLMGFTGNDTRGLFYIENGDTLLIDIIGKYDFTDPGTGWMIDMLANATKDHTLIRKKFISSGNDNWPVSSGILDLQSEWDIYPVNFSQNLGIHNFNKNDYDNIIDTLNNQRADTVDLNPEIDTSIHTENSEISNMDIQEEEEEETIEPNDEWNDENISISEDESKETTSNKPKLPLTISKVTLWAQYSTKIAVRIKIINESALLPSALKVKYGYESGMYFFNAETELDKDSINVFVSFFNLSSSHSAIYYMIEAEDSNGKGLNKTVFYGNFKNLTNINQCHMTSEVQLYPNPCSEKLFIKAAFDIQDIIILNATGKQVLKSEFQNQKTAELEVGELQQGWYFVQIIGNQQIVLKKIAIN